MVGGLAWLNALYAYLVWLMALGTSVVVTLILIASAVVYSGGYPDPFAPYDALRLGQPTQVLENFDCRAMDYPYEVRTSVCWITPEDGVFTRVVVISKDDRLQYVNFYGETLQVVDLVRRWGMPQVVTQAGADFSLRWQDGIVAFAPMAARRFNHLLPVKLVIIGSMDDSS